MNLFYAPDITAPEHTLDPAESKHLVKVLRMNSGDEVFFTDGNGFFYRCEITAADPRACRIRILEKYQGDDRRHFEITLAVAPTKNINRYEWFLEKATEIGTDRFIPFFSRHSERKTVKTDRLNRVITAAVKQSVKSFHPVLEEPLAFEELIKRPFNGQKFIAYIHPDVQQELWHTYRKGENVLILIGPEGDFSPEEVESAKKYDFIPVSLGPSRLRTETAGVLACHTVHLLNR